MYQQHVYRDIHEAIDGRLINPEREINECLMQCNNLWHLIYFLIWRFAPTGRSGPCLNITFDPNIMPAGVEGAADPMLRARTAPYAISLGRRIVEGSKQQ